MRPASLLGWLALGAVATSLALCAAAGLMIERTVAAKLDRAAELEQDAVRPAAAARLAAALLGRRLAQAPDPGSQAIAAAFQHSPAAEALAGYRAAGGDPAIAAEAEKAIGAGAAKPPGPDAEIALMRAVRELSAEAGRAPKPSRPAPPLSASRSLQCLLAAAAAAAVASALAYGAGRRAAAPGAKAR